MKSLRSILAVLAIFVLGSASFAANTIVVRHGETSTPAASLQAAMTAAVAGDTIDITSYDTPIDIGAGLRLDGVSLVCSAATPAVLNVTAVPNVDPYGLKAAICTSKDVTLRNIKLVGRGASGDGENGVLPLGGTFVMDGCTVSDFAANCVWLAAFDTPEYGGKLAATIKYCYLLNSFCSVFASAAAKATSVLVDHNTMAGNANCKLVQIDGSWESVGNDLTETVYTNNIFLAQAGIGAVFFPGVATADLMKLTHKYNAYFNIWAKFWLSGAGEADKLTMDATEIEFPIDWTTPTNSYKKAVNFDFTLTPYTKLCGNGENDSNIGADKSNYGKVTGNIIVVRQDGKGDYNDLQKALDASQAGDQVWIAQGNNWTRNGDSIWVNHGEKLVGKLANGQKPVLTSDSDRVIQLQSGSTLDGVKVVPSRTGQAGVVCQDANIRVTNCEISDFSYAAIQLFTFTGTNATNILSGSVDHCLIINNHVAFEFYKNDDGTPAMGDFVIDHCTFIQQDVTSNTPGNSITFNSGFTAKFDGSKVTIKNNIFDQQKWGFGHINFDSTTAPAFKVSYNDYIKGEKAGDPKRSYWNVRNENDSWVSDGPLTLGQGEIENVDPLFSSNYHLLKNSPVKDADENGASGDGLGAFKYTGISAAKGWTIYN